MEVMNLATGQVAVYVGLTPKQAVIAAFEFFERGNKNTWQYPEDPQGIYESSVSVSRGNWCALKLDRVALRELRGLPQAKGI
jgi:hypothetical protein